MSVWLPRGYRAETELEVKRSRFLATLARVDSEDAARDLIADVRSRHPKARHHCTGFIVGLPDEQLVERSSDDGEPAGTAGRPIMDALRAAELGNVVAVVTRYFGGILLGTGGLARAYSDAVAQAAAQAPRVRPVERLRFTIEVDAADAGSVDAELRRAGASIVSVSYAQQAELVVLGTALLPELVARLTRGVGRVTSSGSAIDEQPVV